MEAYHALAQHVEFINISICPVVYILKLVFLIIDVTFFGWLFFIMTRNVPTLNKLKFIIRINQSIDQ